MTDSINPTCPTEEDPSILEMLDRMSMYQWLEHMQILSGEIPVVLSGSVGMVTTRYTPRLFDGTSNVSAFQYLKEQLALMHYPMNSEVNLYGYYEDGYLHNGTIYKNLVLTIPGFELVDPYEVILSAHLDDLPQEDSPGADDNGVGVAALLEMARVLRYYQFDGTIRLIWFTGSEQGLLGSRAYLLDRPFLFESLLGAINLDGFGYDADGDDCFEIHMGSFEKSSSIGNCLVNSIVAYSIPLHFDFIEDDIPEGFSDQHSFWEFGLPAIGIVGNRSARNAKDAYQQCGDSLEQNPYEHTREDTLANAVDASHAFDIMRVSLATSAALSNPRGACFNIQPVLNGDFMASFIHLGWNELGPSTTYQVYRSLNGCHGTWIPLGGQINVNEYYDLRIQSLGLAYQVEAVSPLGTCVSLPSNCLEIMDMVEGWVFFPIAIK